MSTALISIPHRCCTPKKNRRIPTILAGCVDGGLVDVSAVDTGPRGSESGFLVVEPGAVAVWNHCHSCLRPCVVCRTQPPATWGHITRHQRHDLKHRALSGAHAKARRPWFNADPARLEPALPRSCLESVYSTRVGIY